MSFREVAEGIRARRTLLKRIRDLWKVSVLAGLRRRRQDLDVGEIPFNLFLQHLCLLQHNPNLYPRSPCLVQESTAPWPLFLVSYVLGLSQLQRKPSVLYRVRDMLPSVW